MWSSSLLLLLTAALLAAATIEPDSIQATSPTQKTSSTSSSSKPLTLTTIDDGKSNLDYYGRSMIFGLRDLVGSDWSRSRRSVAKPPLDRTAKQQQQQMNLDMERYRRSMQQVSAGKLSPQQQQQQQQQQQPSQQPKARNNNRTRSESVREQRRRCRLRGTCRGRNWCPDMDVGNRAYLAPTVFEGKARSMSSLRKPGSNYAVTFEVKRVYKSQAGFMPLQTNDSVRLHFRDKSGGGGGGKSGLCQSVNSATTALPTTLTTSMGQGVAHNLRTSNSGTLNILDAMAAVGSGSSNGDDGMVRANIKRGKVYLVFVNRVGPRNFTILGEPVIRSKKNEQAIQAVLRPDYASRPPTENPIRHVLRTPLDSDRPIFELSVVTTAQVLRVIAGSRSKAVEPDHLSTVMLKKAAPLIASPLQEIINLSITSHTFSSTWRTTYVLPLSKKKVITNISDTRPIAKLCEMS
ncbi:hypothetical protein TKK_0005909 [Trichogramma kaykai]